MNIKASGRSALIIAAGIWACFSGPLQATESADSDVPVVSRQDAQPESAGAPIKLSKFAKHPSQHWKKKVAHRKFSKVALKSSRKHVAAADTKIAAADIKSNDVKADDSIDQMTLPPSVANANAQMLAADTPAGNAKAMSARANTILQAAPAKPDDAADSQASPAGNADVVSADQLNDVDRALQENKAPVPALVMAAAEAPVPAAAPAPAAAMANSNDDSTWGQTSLIGKIFIAFGGLLTLASAARMFMA